MGGVIDFLGNIPDPVSSGWSSGVNSTDLGPGQGSTVTLLSPEEIARREAANSATAQQHTQQSQQAAHGRAQGYLANMAPGGQNYNLAPGMNSGPMPAAPNAQWAYRPGQGPVWQTPERTINRAGTTDQERNWKLTDAKPGSPYGGNRF